MTPHRQLLADYAESGSEEAFRELVSSYVGLVHGSALRLVGGNMALAEDIAQIVFTDLARKAKTLSPAVMVGGWLHRRTCYAAATALRTERRRQTREQEALAMNFLNPDETDEALAQVIPVLDEAINQLGAEDRDAIALRFFESGNFRAVGEALGTSEAAAQKRVERALEKLRALLMRRGVALSATAIGLAVGTASASAAPAGLAATISTTALASVPAGAGLSLTTLKIIAMTKLKLAVIAAVALVAVGTTTTVILYHDPAYTPPAHPNPGQILNDGQADARAGKYKDALAKYVWYRDNALKYEPSQMGVRNSFALTYWADLAKKYPPAMKKLVAIRKEAEKQVKEASVQSAVSGFLIISSFNLGMKEDSKTVDLFKWLDAHNPAAARQVYPAVERNLIGAREYEICGRYLDSTTSYDRLLDMYKTTMDIGKKNGAPQIQDFAKKNFSNQSAALVAVLTIDKRYDEAAEVAGKAAREMPTPELTALLAAAKKGEAPPNWP